MSEPLPQVIGGRYQVTRKLGQGGMGAVYEAVDGATGRTVAVKTIISELARDPTLMGRFEREAKAAAALDTPHIVAVLDSGRDEAAGLSYMVMEYLDGEDYQQLLRRLGPVSPDLALRVAAQACLALQKAHDKRIVHRDIKPANFFLTRREGGQRLVKLLDFGVAKVRKEATQDSAETKGLTRTGSMLGSPLYMSPEQARGHKDIDHRSDIWSLGVVMYQALAGRTPHGDTDELGELIILICTEPPEPIQDVAPWVPPEVATIVHRAMRFSPGERFASAGEMLAAMTPLLRGSMAISEAMLRPLSDAERLTIAPRLTEGVHDAPPPRRGGASSSSGGGGRTHAGATSSHGGGGHPAGTVAMQGQGAPGYPGVYPGAYGTGSHPAVQGYPAAQSYPGAPPQPYPAAQSYPGAPPQPYPAAQSYPGVQPGAQSYPGGPPASTSYPGVQQGPTSSTLAAGAVGATVHPDGQAPPASAVSARKSSAPLVVAALVGVAALAGVAAFTMTRRGPDPAPTAAAPVPPPSASEGGEKLRTVKLVVLPDGVKVEVDGAPVTPKDGVVEIRGALGTEHKVRLFRLGPDGATDGELEKDVAVTENGASPAKLDLSTVAPTPAASATTTASAPKRLGGPLPRPNTGGPVLRNDR